MEKNDLKECHGWSRRWKKMILSTFSDIIKMFLFFRMCCYIQMGISQLKIESISVVLNFVLKRFLLSVFMCRSRYEADLAVSNLERVPSGDVEVINSKALRSPA
jgi:hypothetical protein